MKIDNRKIYVDLNQMKVVKSCLILSSLIVGMFLSMDGFSQSFQPSVLPEQYTHEKKLPNGLRVIVREDHRSPTVAHMIWYKAGSVDEYNGTTGVAHVLEHMMFKGTKSLGPGEFSKKVAGLGGRENAFTSYDYTAYFQQIGKQYLPQMMELEADRMQNLNLSEDEFKKEIQVIMEERRLRTDDQASSLLYEQLMSTAFNSAPNRTPVIGWMADLQNMNYLDARDWYQKWYAPSNAILIVVGDVDPNEIFKLAEQTYGKVTAKVVPDRKKQTEPVQVGQRRFSVKAPAENTIIMMGWKAPKILNNQFEDDEPFALTVLSAILDGNQNTRLNRVLVKNKKLLQGVGASYDAVSRGEQLFIISADLLPGKKIENIEIEIKKILTEVAQKGVTEAELKRVKIAVTASQIYKRDSVFGQAMEIGSNEISGIPWKDLDKANEKIQNVTSEQIQAVVKKYLIDDHLTVGILDPQSIDPKTQEANAKAAAHLK